MIYITPEISISENEFKFEFIRASGPGGQNVNKVSSAVQLRFDVKNSPSLPNDVRARLKTLSGHRITDNGILILNARRFRTQAQNRQDAVDRLVELVRKAAEKPKKRKKTRPSANSKTRIKEAKRRRSNIKRLRKPVSTKDE